MCGQYWHKHTNICAIALAWFINVDIENDSVFTFDTYFFTRDWTSFSEEQCNLLNEDFDCFSVQAAMLVTDICLNSVMWLRELQLAESLDTFLSVCMFHVMIAHIFSCLLSDVFNLRIV